MVVAIKEKDRIVAAYFPHHESLEETMIDPLHEENLPIRIFDDKIVLFCNGGVGADCLLYDDELWQGEITPARLLKEVIPIIKSRGKQYGFFGEGYWGNALVVLQDGRLMRIDPFFRVSEISDFLCHGRQPNYVNGTLLATKGEPAEQRILKATRLYGKAFRIAIEKVAVVDDQQRKINLMEV